MHHPCRLRAALAVLFALLACRCHARRLLDSAQCDPGTSGWDYYACYNATGTSPPPRVQAADGPPAPGPAPALPPCLAPRWGGADPSDPAAQPDCAEVPNPFVAKDGPTLVQSSQGAGVSGARTIGFRAGGAQDVENFRQNIAQGYLPMPTDMTYEGLIKSYYFDTSSNTSAPCQDLFCPVYSLGLAPDPLMAAAAASKGGSPPPSDVFLAVGLDSGLKASEFKRKKLHLVVVLDVSGSMGSSFDAYYYDDAGTMQNLTQAELKPTKMDVAKEVLQGILDKLDPDDLFSVVLFSDSACAPKRMGPVRCADMAAIKKHIDEDVTATDSTSISSGIDMAIAELDRCSECHGASLADTETRIMLITDEQPNLGDTSSDGLMLRLQALAAMDTFFTIIGVGLDFNTELVEAISKVKGALYFSVHSPGEFKRRLVDDFDYAVTPLVFDLSLSVDSASLASGSGGDGWRILHAYGSPNPDDMALSGNGTILTIDTLFPSPKTEEGIKGGVVLLRMAPPLGGAVPLQLTVNYTDRTGKQFRTQRTVAFPEQPALAPGASLFQSSGVEKAVLLAHYADMLQGWLVDEWGSIDRSKTVTINATMCSQFPSAYCTSVDADHAYGKSSASKGACQLDVWVDPTACILPVPTSVEVQLGQWERTSQPLTVKPAAKEAFAAFLPYLEREMAAVKDETLEQEVELLKKLIAV